MRALPEKHIINFLALLYISMKFWQVNYFVTLNGTQFHIKLSYG